MAEKVISNKEYKAVSKALFELLDGCEVLPEGVPLKYQSIGAEKSVALFTLPGAKYLKKHIDGSFAAQLAFQILYKAKAQGNGQMMESQTVLDDISDWLEEAAVPGLTDNRRILEITVNSTTYVTDKDDAGYVEYTRTGTLKYEKEAL